MSKTKGGEYAKPLREAVFESTGHTPRSLRQQILSRVKSGVGSPSSTEEMPAVVAKYVDAVNSSASTADLESLRAAGYSEDAIFEITLAAATASGLTRIERALALLSAAS